MRGKRSVALCNELKSSWKRGKESYRMVEDGHLEAEGDEGKHW
jgi:hypothetical protein